MSRFVSLVNLNEHVGNNSEKSECGGVVLPSGIFLIFLQQTIYIVKTH